MSPKFIDLPLQVQKDFIHVQVFEGLKPRPDMVLHGKYSVWINDVIKIEGEFENGKLKSWN